MKITINDHRKVFAIEEEFNQMFPNLKIEFMAKPSAAGAKHSDMPVAQSKTIADCRLPDNTQRRSHHHYTHYDHT